MQPELGGFPFQREAQQLRLADGLLGEPLGGRGGGGGLRWSRRAGPVGGAFGFEGGSFFVLLRFGFQGLRGPLSRGS